MSEEPQWTAWKAYLDSLFNPGGAGYAAIHGQLLGIAVDPSERTVRRLFWRDDMENYTTMKWFSLDPNDSLTYVNNPLRGAFEGNYVLRLLDPIDRSVEANALFGRFPLDKCGFEIRWWLNGNITTITFIIRFFTGTERRVMAISYHNYTPAPWFYVDSGGVEHAIPGAGGAIRGDTWNYTKIVSDFENGRMDALITNETGVEGLDLSAYPLQVIPDGTGRSTQVSVYVYAGAPNLPIYLDDARVYLFEE